MKNVPDVRLGIVAVSRDCFPVKLSERRRSAVKEACSKRGIEIFEAKTTVENERDAMAALSELRGANVNAAVIYLGNFGPEGPETMLAQKLNMPVMFAAAAEERGDDLINGRGDAYCGMLNVSYNLGLRKINAYIPSYPVGTADETAQMIGEFTNIARALTAIKKLKVFGFGPRPYDFLACNAPIAPLFDLGIEVQENSELDLFASFNGHADDSRIAGVMADMESEVGSGNEILRKLAQYEITLTDWMENNLGASEYAVFANKCWPAFQTQFGFVPCYVNSRFAQRGIPIACETDIYGAVSEYIIACATLKPPTLLDINNTVPRDMYESGKNKFKGYKESDAFMGFHCGNTPGSCMKNAKLKYHLIMKRLLEPDVEPDITRGTLEGALFPGDVTLFRLQSTADCRLQSYIAPGEVIDVDPQSFGSIGIIAVSEMDRFYRHVLIEKRYPHHAGVAFCDAGKTLFEIVKLLGVQDISFNRPKGMLYKSENPFIYSR